MKIIFAGTPEFAVPTLTALLQSSHQLCAVYTQPDRPAGRGQKLTASPIKQLALSHNIPVFQPITLRNIAEQEQLRNLQADVMIVVAYGLLLPKAILDIPRFGCINVHPSLLPRWRGATPIQSAILAGDTETGVTIMQMDEGMDSGPILKEMKYPINAVATSGELHQQLAQLGAQALIAVLEDLTSGKLKPQKQDNTLVTYSKKIDKAVAKLDWRLSAVELDRKIRAYNPWPVAFTEFDENVVRIWRAEPSKEKNMQKPGTITQINKTGIAVATGEGLLKILELQLAGGKRLSIVDFMNAKKNFFSVGESFN